MTLVNPYAAIFTVLLPALEAVDCTNTVLLAGSAGMCTVLFVSADKELYF
jgi:hypothetical protein